MNIPYCNTDYPPGQSGHGLRPVTLLAEGTGDYIGRLRGGEEREEMQGKLAGCLSVAHREARRRTATVGDTLVTQRVLRLLRGGWSLTVKYLPPPKIPPAATGRVICLHPWYR